MSRASDCELLSPGAWIDFWADARWLRLEETDVTRQGNRGVPGWIAYAVLLLIAVGAVLSICIAGERLAPGGGPASPEMKTGTDSGDVSMLSNVLLAVAVIVFATRAAGILVSLLGQPPVIGEVVGGILIGPSVLGSVAPDAMAYLLPDGVAPFLAVIAQLGVILYMFLVGLELDFHLVHGNGRATIAIAHTGIAVPFVLGAALALGLYEGYAASGASFTAFALFMGVALSVTALPVLARILTDQRVHQTRLGAIAIACAGAGDATAWCLLAVVVSIVQARLGDALRTIVLTIGFFALILYAARPAVHRWLPRIERGRESGIAIIFVSLVLAALAAEYIGVHAIFGAFLLGVIVPHDSRLAKGLRQRLEAVVTVLFLPVFFAFIGMRTEIGLIRELDQWLLCGLIVAAACAGKIGGTLAAARWTGLGWRESTALGVLMNTRGLVELIVLNIGLELGIISPALFAMLVVMALVTTFMTSPLLGRIMSGSLWDKGDPRGTREIGEG